MIKYCNNTVNFLCLRVISRYCITNVMKVECIVITSNIVCLKGFHARYTRQIVCHILFSGYMLNIHREFLKKIKPSRLPAFQVGLRC